MSEREVWYVKVDASELARAVRTQGTTRQVKRLRKLPRRARRKDSARAFEKLAARVDGTPRIVPDHPLIVTSTCVSWRTGRAPRIPSAFCPPVLTSTRGCAGGCSRAHTRAQVTVIAIAAYLGRGNAFEKAIADFSEVYADQNERDYEALVRAVKTGRLIADRGL